MKRKLVVTLVCLLLITTTVIAPIAEASVIQILRINVDGARLRSTTNIKTVIRSLPKGSKVLYAGKKKGAFCCVMTTSGEIGYVYGPFLSTYGAVQSKQLYKTTQRAPVYTKPSTKAELVGMSGNGQAVFVYEARSGWAYIKSMTGKGGYIQTKYLTR